MEISTARATAEDARPGARRTGGPMGKGRAGLDGWEPRPDKVRSGRGGIGLGAGLGPIKESPKAWWGKGREAPRAIGSPE